MITNLQVARSRRNVQRHHLTNEHLQRDHIDSATDPKAYRKIVGAGTDY